MWGMSIVPFFSDEFHVVTLKNYIVLGILLAVRWNILGEFQRTFERQAMPSGCLEVGVLRAEHGF